MKIVAFYLPQFHTIPENDAWWGNGFTEWVNVKSAQPLYSGHEQPKEPLDDNYYDLSDVSTLEWQASLANKYGIYGMCFYHYWFPTKMLLQKPAELLLAHKEIKMRFCFSWANEPWTRSWDGKSHQILINQDYGGLEEWRRHFNYLLPFFKDERYMKVDGKPMFVIYKSRCVPCAKEMMECWLQMAQANGLPGIHFVNTLRERGTDCRDLPFENYVEFEPAYTNHNRSSAYRAWHRVSRMAARLSNRWLGTKRMLNKPVPFGEIAKLSLRSNLPKGTYGGVFVGWDNSPRRGLAGSVILPPTKEEFKLYLRDKIKLTQQDYHTDYVFVNAWNEWAEGTVLEPTKQHGYDYLEAISEVMDEMRENNSFGKEA